MQKIYSLQYLRAFAAIWVLLTHVLQQCEVRPNGVFWAGLCSLYAVMVISFILTIVASSAIYLLVEKRFINLAKQLINRRKIIS